MDHDILRYPWGLLVMTLGQSQHKRKPQIKVKARKTTVWREGCVHDWLVSAKLTNPLINPSESLSMTQQQHISHHLQKERQGKYMVIVMLQSIKYMCTGCVPGSFFSAGELLLWNEHTVSLIFPNPNGINNPNICRKWKVKEILLKLQLQHKAD